MSEEAQKDGVHLYGTFCVLLDGKAIAYKPGNPGEVKRVIRERGAN